MWMVEVDGKGDDCVNGLLWRWFLGVVFVDLDGWGNDVGGWMVCSSNDTTEWSGFCWGITDEGGWLEC